MISVAVAVSTSRMLTPSHVAAGTLHRFYAGSSSGSGHCDSQFWNVMQAARTQSSCPIAVCCAHHRQPCVCGILQHWSCGLVHGQTSSPQVCAAASAGELLDLRSRPLHVCNSVHVCLGSSIPFCSVYILVRLCRPTLDCSVLIKSATLSAYLFWHQLSVHRSWHSRCNRVHVPLASCSVDMPAGAPCLRARLLAGPCAYLVHVHHMETCTAVRTQKRGRKGALQC